LTPSFSKCVYVSASEFSRKVVHIGQARRDEMASQDTNQAALDCVFFYPVESSDFCRQKDHFPAASQKNARKPLFFALNFGSTRPRCNKNRATHVGHKSAFPQLRKKMLENRCFLILISGARDLAAI
jgi:hypothetical protein